MVSADPLLERLREKEKDVKLIRVKCIEECQHCDFYLAASAVEWCFADIMEDIEKTRPDSGSEIEGGRSNAV